MPDTKNQTNIDTIDLVKELEERKKLDEKRRLRERETEDDDGPEWMRPNVREGNAAQGQRAVHQLPSPARATLIHRAGRTPY